MALAKGDTLLTDDSKKIVGVKNADGTELYFTQSNVALAYPYDSDGIAKAHQRILDTGKPGAVLYASARYSATRNQPMANWISHVGQGVVCAFSGDIPDTTLTPTEGTIIVIADGVEFLTFNSVDLAAQLPNLATQALTGVTICAMGFIGGKGAIKIGALYAMGPTYCRFDDLYFKNQIDYHFYVENYQHCHFGVFQGNNSTATGTGGFHYIISTTSALLPGNSDWFGEQYSYSTSRWSKNFVFRARGGAGSSCQMNELAVKSRMQYNRYGSSAQDYVMTSTGGNSPDWTLQNPAQIDDLPVGMPLVFYSSTPQFLASKAVYYVCYNDGVSKIRLNFLPEQSTTGTNISNAATHTAKSSGFPGLIVHANANSLINNCDFGQNWDAEAASNVVSSSFYKVFGGSSIGYHEIMASVTNTALAARDSPMVINCRNMTGVSTDFDDTLRNTKTVVNNLAAGNRYLDSTVMPSNNYTLTASDHQCKLMINNASANTITVPDIRLSGFNCRFFAIGAGQTTMTASGSTVNGFGGALKSAGQYARFEIDKYDKSAFVVSGNTTV